MRFSPDLCQPCKTGFWLLEFNNNVTLRYFASPRNMNNVAWQRGQEWKCTWVELLGLPGVCTHFPTSLSEGPESNYGIQSGNGKYICHTLSHSDRGLKFAINFNFPLVPDKAFVLSGWCKTKGTWAQELTWSYHYIYRYAALCAIRFALVLFTEQTYQLYDASFRLLLAWGHWDKCRMGCGLLEDKTAFSLPPFEIPLVWHGWYRWVAQLIDSARAGHMWEITHGHGQMKGFCTLPVTTAVTDTSALMTAPYFQHLPHPANLLAFL